MDILFTSFVVLLFAAVILAVEGLYLWWMSTHGTAARRIARRLQVMSGGMHARANERISILKQRRYSRQPMLDRLLHRTALAQRIDGLLIQAGATWSVSHFIGATFGCVALALGLSAVWTLPLPARLVLCVGSLGLPWWLLYRMRMRRLIRIEHQLPDAADFIARALRAGHSFTNVLQIVGNELPEPLAGEFRIAREEINYGVPMNEALHGLAARIPLTDLRYLVIAVLIQRDSGGNLAEILGNISGIIRARLKLVAQVRVLSAEGRMSAWILGLLPFGVMGMLALSSPDYISMLWTDPSGVRLLWCGLGMIVFGVLWLRQTIRIRV